MTEERVWNYLIENGMTPHGAAGLMGNLKAESGIIFNRVEILCLKRLKEHGKEYTDASYTKAVDDGTISREEFLHPLPNKQYGYGLCQWTSPGRKAGLYDLCKARKVSIADEKAQLDWLLLELQNDYKSTFNILKTATSVATASTMVLKNFECPADVGTAMQNTRASYGQAYYDKYAKKSQKKVLNTDLAKSYTEKLLKHYPFTYCPTLAGVTSNKTPHKGDVVLFYRNGVFAHTGYVYKVSGSTYYTIEGNTSGASGVVANGGGVCKKSYSTSQYPGTKFFQPDYSMLVSAGYFKSVDEVINAIVSCAEAEVGYLEKKSSSGLDDKTANAGSANYTKYWRDIYPAFQGQAWCACFVTWIIQNGIKGSSTTTTVISSTERTSLRKGDTGFDVKSMQQMLIAVGYSCGPDGADGDFGANTETALKKFQHAYALSVDGVYGPVSKSALTKAYNKKTTAASNTQYMVKVTVDELNIRTGASTSYSKTGCIRDRGCYTIVETKGNWGKLKSGLGWICLDYCEKL